MIAQPPPVKRQTVGLLLTRLVVIMLAKNEEAFLARTLAALQNQTLPPERVIVVDGHSSDRTVEIAESFAKADHRIILTRSVEPPQTRHHKNIPRAFNEGLRAAPHQWDYLAKIDADTVLEPTYFEKIVVAFERDPVLGIAGGQTDNALSRTVRGGNRVFRRGCWDTISDNGLMPVIDSEDTFMDLKAGCAGWRVQLLSNVHSLDLRPPSQGPNLRILKRCWQLGSVSYMLGYHPLLFVGRTIKMAMFNDPRIVTVLPMVSGWVWAFIAGRRIDEKLRKYQRIQQAARLHKVISALAFSPMASIRELRRAEI
jgi:glycosyltransferase involved in cell wall biosynthesis